jgi:Uma2 family endonuclease
MTDPQPKVIDYPDCDGEPMSDNTVQFDWISIIKWNLEYQFASRPDVFVAGDHLIYPVEGDPQTRQAPDVYVAFGPQKGDRGSYKVWVEGGVFPQVVFEVWSPNNRFGRMEAKRDFYQQYGAEEYYILYPEFPCYAEGWIRTAGVFVSIPEMNGWISPKLGIRFAIQPEALSITGPDGREFRTPSEIAAERDVAERRAEEEHRRAEEERLRAEGERLRAEGEHQRAEGEHQRAEEERLRAEGEHQRAEEERQRADAEASRRAAERERAEKFAAKLRELGLDPDAM